MNIKNYILHRKIFLLKKHNVLKFKNIMIFCS